MTHREIRSLLPLLPLALAACTDDTAALALDEASRDLQCPAASIQLDETGKHTAARDDHVYLDYRATGCKKTAGYACKYIDAPVGPQSCECALGTVITATSSTVLINGRPFVPDGEQMCIRLTYAFGVELRSPEGDRLRVLQNEDFSYEAVAMKADGSFSPPLRDCAIIRLARDRAISGEVTLDCAVDGWQLSGSAAFQGC